MFKNSNYKNPNYSSINYVVSIYNRCLFAKCIVKVFPNLFVFTFGIENIRLVLKLYLSLSLCAGSRPFTLQENHYTQNTALSSSPTSPSQLDFSVVS